MGPLRETVGGLIAHVGLNIASSHGDLEREVRHVVLWDAEGAPPIVNSIVILPWSPVQAGGPLPDISSTLAILLQQNPAAVVVCPDRLVNAPQPYISIADAYRIPLLWEHGRNCLQLEEQLASHLTSFGGTEDLASSTSSLLHVLQQASDLASLTASIEKLLQAEISITSHRRADLPPEVAGSDVALDASEIEVALFHGSEPIGVCLARRSSPFSPDERTALKALGPVLSLAFRMTQLEEDPGVLSLTLLRRILGEDLHLREASLRKSRRLSIFPDAEVTFLVLEPFGIATTLDGMRKLAATLAPAVSKFDAHAMLLLHEGAVLIVVRSTVDLDALTRAMCRSAQAPLVVGASEPSRGARRYAGAFRQAQRAVSVARRVRAVNRITAYGDLGVLGVFYQMPEHVRRDFVKLTLGEVAGSSADAREYRSILQTMHNTGGNVAEAARQLYIHPNTLRQRITRIEGLIGDFQNDANLRLSVYTALSMFRLDSGREDGLATPQES